MSSANGTRRPSIQDLRRLVRRTLALQLATMLRGPSTMPDGSQGTVLDDIVARSLVGYGFTLELKVRHPDAPEEVSKNLTPAAAKPLIIQ